MDEQERIASMIEFLDHILKKRFGKASELTASEKAEILHIEAARESLKAAIRRPWPTFP